MRFMVIALIGLLLIVGCGQLTTAPVRTEQQQPKQVEIQSVEPHDIAQSNDKNVTMVVFQ